MSQKSKSQEKREEAMKVEKFEEKVKAKRSLVQYWYSCEACTNIASYGNEPRTLNPVTCHHCGAVRAFRPENWIRMTKEQIKAYNKCTDEEASNALEAF